MMDYFLTAGIICALLAMKCGLSVSQDQACGFNGPEVLTGMSGSFRSPQNQNFPATTPSPTQDDSLCDPGYCVNDGICYLDSRRWVQCNCLPGYDGPRCQYLRNTPSGNRAAQGGGNTPSPLPHNPGNTPSNTAPNIPWNQPPNTPPAGQGNTPPNTPANALWQWNTPAPVRRRRALALQGTCATPADCNDNGFCYLHLCACYANFTGSHCQQFVEPISTPSPVNAKARMMAPVFPVRGPCSDVSDCHNNGYCYQRECWCYSNFTGLFCNTSSPAHQAGYYPPNLNCGWKIDIPADYEILLEFSQFSLEWIPNCINDDVTVFDGINESLVLAGPYCGHHSQPIRVNTGASSVLVKFRTDYARSGAGFYVVYTTQPRGNAV